jgi:hypothetical protein
MEAQKIKAMETQVRFLHKKMTNLSDEDFLKTMLDNIKKPGWTSVAEGFLIEQMLHLMQKHTEQLLTLKVTLANAAALITHQQQQDAIAMTNCAAARAEFDDNCAQIFSLIPTSTPEARAEVKRLEQANLKLMKANPKCRLLPC